MGVGMLGVRPQAVLRQAGLSLLFMLALGASLLAMVPSLAHAQIGSDRYSSLVIDAESGQVLSAANPDAPRYPASLTKMMTLYLAFEALRDQRITLSNPVPVSLHAASQEPSKLGLVPGMRLTVQEAILALVTKSANDAAAALGETLGGSEGEFAQMMTLRARALGMTHTTFRNASGLPDAEQVTTARDMAILARHLVQDFPDQYRYFSVPGFIFHGRMIPNHDRMLTTYEGADGIKTGYTEAAGHNLVTSAMRGNIRLIGVVLGAGSNGERDLHMAVLLNQGFAQLGAPPASGFATAGFGGFIGTAHAATLPVAFRGHSSAQARLAAARWRQRHGRLVRPAAIHAPMSVRGPGGHGGSHPGATRVTRATHPIIARAKPSARARLVHAHACGAHPKAACKPTIAHAASHATDIASG